MKVSRENKIRVLLVAPYKGVIGGISNWTGHIFDYYSKYKHNNIELTHYHYEGKGVYKTGIHLARIYRGLRTYIPHLIGLQKELKEQDYDVIHFVSSASISLLRDLLSIRMAKKRNVKTIVHFRFGRIPELYKNNNWEQKLLHKVICLADKVIVIDQKSYDTLLEVGYRNIELLPNPLTPRVLDIINKNKGVLREDRKLLFVGHVIETKGVFELIDACRSIPNIRLKLLGFVTDEMKRILTHRAGDSASDWFEISGMKDFETIITEMLSTNVFVFPTYTEGFPNVIIESMACACPIVTTNVGAIPEMLDIQGNQDFGICIEPRSVDQLIDAINRMLSDKSFALQCGINAQKRVEELYSMPIVWEKLNQIWESCIDLHD